MGAALKILADVLSYRLRRLEMANLAGALAIMVALRLPLFDIAVRGAFAFVLNVLAYLINDVVDLERDLASGRALDKTRYLAAHRRSALLAEALLGLVLVAIALAYSPELLVAGVLGAGICWVYTKHLKHVPVADVVSMTLWGAAMPLVAVPFDRELGFALLAQLALFSACFELIQVLRDRASDAELGITTSAVRLGAERTLVVLRVTMLLSAFYAITVLHQYIGLALLIAPLLPAAADPERYWNRVRLVFGLVWLGIIAATALDGGSAGALISVRD